MRGGRTAEPDRARPAQFVAHECPVGGLPQAEADALVAVAQVDPLGQADLTLPDGEGSVPFARGSVLARQVAGVQEPPRRGQDRATVAHGGQERQHVGGAPLEARAGRGERGGRLGEEPRQRVRMVGQVHRVEHDRVHGTSPRDGDQVQAPGIGGDSQVRDGDLAAAASRYSPIEITGAPVARSARRYRSSRAAARPQAARSARHGARRASGRTGRPCARRSASPRTCRTGGDGAGAGMPR